MKSPGGREREKWKEKHQYHGLSNAKILVAFSVTCWRHYSPSFFCSHNLTNFRSRFLPTAREGNVFCTCLSVHRGEEAGERPPVPLDGDPSG